MDEADLIVAVGARFDDRVTGALDEFARGREDRAHRRRRRRDRQERRRRTCRSWATRARRWTALTRELDALRPGPGAARRVVGADRRLARRAPAARAASRAETAAIDPEAALDALAGARSATRSSPPTSASTRCGRPNRLRFDAPAALAHLAAGWARWASACRPRSAPRPRRPDATVVCVTGDGSLLMNVQELATAVEEELPVKVVLLDNAGLGMVRQQQDLFWGGRRAASALGGALDWELVAAGSASRRAASTSPTSSTTRWPRRSPSPARRCCASAIAPDADCLPMFRPGGPAREMIG